MNSETYMKEAAETRQNSLPMQGNVLLIESTMTGNRVSSYNSVREMQHSLVAQFFEVATAENIHEFFRYGRGDTLRRVHDALTDVVKHMDADAVAVRLQSGPQIGAQYAQMAAKKAFP